MALKILSKFFIADEQEWIMIAKKAKNWLKK